MAEIFRNSVNQKASIELPGSVTGAVVAISKDGTELTLGNNAATREALGVFTYPIPYAATMFDGKLTVAWTFSVEGINQTVVQEYDVVTPLVSEEDLVRISDSESPTQEEIDALWRVERNVRKVVEMFTGQSFGYSKGVRRFVGGGGNTLPLDTRLIKMDTATANAYVNYAVSSDGFSIRAISENDLTIKMAPPEEAVFVTHGVIRVPTWYSKGFVEDSVYEIGGEWGYYSVPQDVRAAAILLIADYSTSENTYRDRYVDAMKSADWNLEFNEGAFRGTGNVRADQLLEPYRRNRMVII